jgi:hypothetical protein
VIPEGDRSYRALFAIPDLPKILLSMQFARIAQSMTAVALVLFALTEYNSPVWPASWLLPGCCRAS